MNKNGKGDAPRPVNYKRFSENWDSIDWTGKNKEAVYTTELFNANSECKHDIVCAPGGGVKCTKCNGWFCY